jgi:putative serine protease PepD
MTTAYDPFGVPGPHRAPLDPLLSLPDHPSGEWATAARPAPRVGHPRPARRAPVASFLPSSTGGAPYPVVADLAARPAPPAPRRRGRLVTILLIVVLLLVTGWQAWRFELLDQQVGASTEKLTVALDRQQQLEKQLAGVFDPEAISSTVLPSVFRVRAGNFTGTAFSIGDKAADGQANLLTNFHVVESVWESGARKVFLERGKDELSATIVKVSKGKDLALLRTNRKIVGLDPARATVKPGQQVVVVGAPLGLEDTVTTGVVSAYRPNDADGPSIQFDAPINPGNSGGPVVNGADEVIGLATAKARDAEGIGIAVPIKTACDTFRVC